MSWEDKYYEIKTEKEELARRYNDLGNTSRTLKTKCAQLESFRRRVNQGNEVRTESVEFEANVVPNLDVVKKPIENKQDYDDLFKCYESLQRTYRAVVTKNKSYIQVISKLKKELESLKRRYAGRRHENIHSKPIGGCTKRVLKEPVHDANCSHEEDGLNHMLLERLSCAEKQLQELRAESKRFPFQQLSLPDASIQACPNVVEDEKEKLGQQLQESTTKLILLRAQYEHAEVKIKAQGDKLEQILTLHGEYKTRYESLKTKLQHYEEENQVLLLKVSTLDEMTEQVNELTEQNNFLEAQVKKFCESPLPVTPKDQENQREKELLKRNIQEKQTAYDLLVVESNELKQKNKQLLLLLNSSQRSLPKTSYRSVTPSIASDSLEIEQDSFTQLEKRFNDKVRDLERKNELLSDQIAINESLQIRIKKGEESQCNQIRTLETKVDELTAKLCETPMKITLKDIEHQKEKELLLQRIQDKQVAYELLMNECNELKKENRERLALNSSSSFTAQNNQNVQRSERDASRPISNTDQMLKAQIAINEALQIQMKEQEHAKNMQISALESKIDELHLNSALRLDRIRELECNLLESRSAPSDKKGEDIFPLRLGPGENVLEINVHSGSFESGSLPIQGETFVLLDFHTFQSELSLLATGLNPIYDFTASYKVDVDRFLLQTLAKEGIQIEVYTLQKETYPVLFAYAKVIPSEFLSEAVKMPNVALRATENDRFVGTLKISMRFARPFGKSLIGDLSKSDVHSKYQISSNVERVIPDALHIFVDRVMLNKGGAFVSTSYFVHFRFIGDELTQLETCNHQGEIIFQHKAKFPIILTHNSFEQVALNFSKCIVRFTLFSGSKESMSTKNDHSFHVVGESHVPLSDLLQNGDLITEMVSMEAKSIGKIHVFGTIVLPATAAITDDMKNNMLNTALSQLDKVIVTISDNENNDIVSCDWFLRMIDPPDGITRTAKSLHYQIKLDSVSDIVSELFSSSSDDKINQYDFKYNVDRIRFKGELSKVPPNDEMMDLFQYLSDNDGLISMRRLDFFVTSQDLKSMILVFQELKCMGLYQRKDIQRIRDNLSGFIKVQSLKEFFKRIFDLLSDDQWQRLVSEVRNNEETNKMYKEEMIVAPKT